MVGKDVVVKKSRSTTGKGDEKAPRTPRSKSSTTKAKDRSPSRAAAKSTGTRSPGRPQKDSKNERSPRKKSPTAVKEKKVRNTTPTRSGSPGRKPLKSRSPARKDKESVQKRAQVLKVEDSDSETDTTASTSRQTRSRRTISKEPSVEIVNNLRSRVRRDNPDIFSLRSNYEPVVRKPIEFSDEDDYEPAPAGKSSSALRAAHVGAAAVTLGYCLGELVLTYLIPLLCGESQCEFRMLGRVDLERIVASCDLAAFFSLTSFFLFNGIVSIVPFGGRKYASLVARDFGFEYVLNGLFALVMHVAIVVAFEVNHVPVTRWVLANYFPLLTSAVALSFLLGAVLYAKALYVRREALVDADQGHLSSFILGGELNPRFGPMDVKFVIVRTCIIGAILYTLCYVYQSTEIIATPPPDAARLAASNGSWTLKLIDGVRVRPTLLVLATLIVVYYADQLFFESGMLSMMEFKSVSWGFLKCNEYLAGLFVYCAVPKYVYDHHIELQRWELLACTTFFLLGYILYRGANSQKHAFRENPYGPLVAKYESIPTTTGKKILCSGYWGFVRHPNYLGDILLHLALVRFVWPTPLVLLFAFIIGHLMLRAYVDNRKCRQRYGVAWSRYCQRVPYLLIPKVF